jgi:hypothetical protein
LVFILSSLTISSADYHFLADLFFPVFVLNNAIGLFYTDLAIAVSKVDVTLLICIFNDLFPALCCRWISKVIRKRHESSVTSLAWHPNNVSVLLFIFYYVFSLWKLAIHVPEP